MSSPDLGAWYEEARHRIGELAGGASPAQLAAPVVACPGWSVHDVIAHVSGIVDDATSGNMDGAAGESWTAAQVARGRVMSVADLLARWDAQAPGFRANLFGAGQVEPSRLAFAAAADLHSHEQDLRAALARPGARDHPAIAWFAHATAGRRVEALAAEGMALRIHLDGAPGVGERDAANVLHAEPFEFFRLVFGRRSAAQIAAHLHGPDAARVAGALTIFGPASADVIE
jgi:uncharacterized protein (TIGR03083 family)